jgi:hypothetical protein
MRKQIIAAVSIIFLFLSYSIYCDETDIAKLIDQLPASSKLNRSKELLANPTDFSNSENKNRELSEEGKKMLLQKAQREIDKAKLIVPKLKKTVKTGKSIFDYPGLIAKGNISYDGDLHEYSLYIGVYLLKHEGKEPYDFRVVFDKNGIIKSVTDVVWRN